MGTKYPHSGLDPHLYKCVFQLTKPLSLSASAGNPDDKRIESGTDGHSETYTPLSTSSSGGCNYSNTANDISIINSTSASLSYPIINHDTPLSMTFQIYGRLWRLWWTLHGSKPAWVTSAAQDMVLILGSWKIKEKNGQRNWWLCARLWYLQC